MQKGLITKELLLKALEVRNPRTTPLYQIVKKHFQEFKRVYAGRFQEQYGYWRDCVDKAVVSFLECGIFELGFAQVHCKECGYSMIVPFSCKGRCFCPSCQQKRAIWWAEWLSEEVLALVPHRQFVFTIPKILRRYFLRNRLLLGDLIRCAWLSLKECFASVYRKAKSQRHPHLLPACHLPHANCPQSPKINIPIRLLLC